MFQKIGVAMVGIETNSCELIPISVLIVPSIAASIKNSILISINSMLHLQGLKLAHPIISNEQFTISVLIGTDCYWRTISLEEMETVD